MEKRIPPTGRAKLNLEESRNKSACQVRNFAEIAPNIGFSEFDFYDLYRSTFENSELGRMKKLLPLHAMAANFGLCYLQHPNGCFFAKLFPCFIR